MQADGNRHDEEYLIPGPEVLMASTMALMTAHAQSGSPSHREAVAAKIVGNLDALSHDPMLSPGFQTLVWSLRLRWQPPARPGVPPAPAFAGHGLWHRSPEVLQ